MTRRKLDPDWQRARCELIARGRAQGRTWREIAASMNLTHDYVRAMYYRYMEAVNGAERIPTPIEPATQVQARLDGQTRQGRVLPDLRCADGPAYPVRV